MYINVNSIEDVEKALTHIKEKYEKEKEEYKLKLNEAIPKPKKMVDYPKLSDAKYHINGMSYYSLSQSFDGSHYFKIKGIYGDWLQIESMDALNKRKEDLIRIIKQYEEDYNNVYAENLEIKSHNEEVQERVKLFMSEVGIPRSFSHSYYKTNKSRTLTKETKQAGYIEDLNRNVPTYVGSKYDSKGEISRIHSAYDKASFEIKKVEREEEEAKKKENQLRDRIILALKYLPDNKDTDKEELFDAILSKCKYLRLAHYLKMNREDWSDGYDYAEVGLSGFIVETDEDKEIYDTISSIITDYEDVDGRYFRDCKYSYDYLFQKVDNELLHDYNVMKQMVDRY